MPQDSYLILLYFNISLRYWTSNISLFLTTNEREWTLIIKILSWIMWVGIIKKFRHDLFVSNTPQLAAGMVMKTVLTWAANLSWNGLTLKVQIILERDTSQLAAAGKRAYVRLNDWNAIC